MSAIICPVATAVRAMRDRNMRPHPLTHTRHQLLKRHRGEVIRDWSRWTIESMD